MRNMILLSACVILAGIPAAPAAMAEDNDALLQASYQGARTGDPEKDTLAYDMRTPSDLWVRFSPECFTGAAVGELAGHAAPSAKIARTAAH